MTAIPEWEMTHPITRKTTIVQSFVRPEGVDVRPEYRRVRKGTRVVMMKSSRPNRYGRTEYSLLAGDGSHERPYRCLAVGDDLNLLNELIAHKDLIVEETK